MNDEERDLLLAPDSLLSRAVRNAVNKHNACDNKKECPIDVHWRGDVTVMGEDVEKWYTNSLRFHTQKDALEYVGALAIRWTQVTRWRAVEATVPENQPYKQGSEDGEW